MPIDSVELGAVDDLLTKFDRAIQALNEYIAATVVHRTPRSEASARHALTILESGD